MTTPRPGDYVIASAVDAPDLAVRISKYLISKGCSTVVARASIWTRRRRQVAVGEKWVLWREPPFGTPIEPPTDRVVRWVREAAAAN